jgi:hypothetical protein
MKKKVGWWKREGRQEKKLHILTQKKNETYQNDILVFLIFLLPADSDRRHYIVLFSLFYP